LFFSYGGFWLQTFFGFSPVIINRRDTKRRKSAPPHSALFGVRRLCAYCPQVVKPNFDVRRRLTRAENRRFKFHTTRSVFRSACTNEPLAVVAMCVCDPDGSPFAIQRSKGYLAQPELASFFCVSVKVYAIFSNDFPVFWRGDSSGLRAYGFIKRWHLSSMLISPSMLAFALP
jgi:hypothetical protein